MFIIFWIATSKQQDGESSDGDFHGGVGMVLGWHGHFLFIKKNLLFLIFHKSYK